MTQKKKIKAKKLAIGLPFNLGQLEFENDEVQQKAAWSLYVELSTRISVQPLHDNEGILRDAGPEIADGPQSLGAIAIDVLNIGLRPFLVKWHPLLKTYEEQKPSTLSTVDHERNWEYAKDLRKELEAVRAQMVIYVDALAKIAGIEK